MAVLPTVSLGFFLPSFEISIEGLVRPLVGLLFLFPPPKLFLSSPRLHPYWGPILYFCDLVSDLPFRRYYSYLSEEKLKPMSWNIWRQVCRVVSACHTYSLSVLVVHVLFNHSQGV